jgi:hypothetical protein
MDKKKIFLACPIGAQDSVDRARSDQLLKHVMLSGQVSVVDQSLFGSTKTDASISDGQAGQSLLVVLEACNQILRETQDSRGLLLEIGRIALDLRDGKLADQQAQQKAQEQEFGKWILAQMMQNPDSLDKLVPMLQTFAEIGNRQSQPAQAAPEEPPNRASRRRQQKLNKKSS